MGAADAMVRQVVMAIAAIALRICGFRVSFTGVLLDHAGLAMISSAWGVPDAQSGGIACNFRGSRFWHGN
jgi:hypothetical protein